MKATFHPIDGPPHWGDGIHWLACLWDESKDMTRPICMAWLSDWTGSPGMDICMLDYILTCDDFRREGHAERLIMECDKRWPNLCLTEGISPAGCALVEKVSPS